MRTCLEGLRRWSAFVLLCCSAIYSTVNWADTELDYLTFATNDEKNTTDIFSQASPAVVSVTSSALRRTMFSPNVLEVPKGAGSGFIWSDSGLVVTNFHVISGADKLTGAPFLKNAIKKGSAVFYSLTNLIRERWNSGVEWMCPNSVKLLIKKCARYIIDLIVINKEMS